MKSRLASRLQTPISEIGPYKFRPGNISRTLMDAYSNAVRMPAKAA